MNQHKISKLRVWFLAARPKTLPASVVPVSIGTLLAAESGHFQAIPALLVLLTAILIQIGTNFANDVYDYEKGADDHSRLGPTRATQAGLVSPQTMKLATGITLFLALLLGIYLVTLGGTPILVIGVFSLLFAVLYTAGPYPLAYLGLGEIFVLLFFGPIACAGTHYVLSNSFDIDAVLLGLSCGLLSAAILVVNNLRDIEGDRRSGKKTLAVRFGSTFARSEYIVCIGLAAALPFAASIPRTYLPWALAAVVFFCASVPVIRIVLYAKNGNLNPALERTGMLLVLFGILYALSVLT